MKMCIPLNRRSANIEKLKKQIVKTGAVKGVYPGYEDLPKNVGIVLIHGFIGWNLFILKGSEEQYVRTCLIYIKKNSKFIAQLLESCKEYMIEFYVTE